ncbi:MAG: hypothetical protein GEU91_19885 [Rhizobiales bacterium]|nr:hypothetical protein [Hyphomicrobiales bacterium]
MTPVPHAGALLSPMLTALLIFVIGRIRRRLRKGKDMMSVIVDSLTDMQEIDDFPLLRDEVLPRMERAGLRQPHR